jgi:hypothetical protein
MFKRRIGPVPSPEVGGSSGANGCPDIWELESGDFAIIGFKASSDLLEALPESAGIEPDEALVVVPRAVVLGARDNLNALEFAH